MKRLILVVGAFVMAVAFPGMTALAGTISVNRTISAPGDKGQIFDKVSRWAERHLSDNRADKGSGVVVAKGEMTYPSPPVDRIQYTIVFKMKNTVQDGRVAVEYEYVSLKSPDTYFSSDTGGGPLTIRGKLEPAKSKGDIEAVTGSLNRVSDNLEAFLKNASDTACPLVTCPECPVLSPSAEDMKEHMKRHEQMKVKPERGAPPKP